MTLFTLEYTQTIYEVCLKITFIFQFRELSMFDFCIFLCCYVGRHVCYIRWQYQKFWIVSLFLTDIKLSPVLVCSSIFYYSTKMDQKKCIKFFVKNVIKCAKTFEMLTKAFGESTRSRIQAQFWNNRFKEDREDVNDVVLVAPACQQSRKTLKHWFWIIVETLLDSLLMMLAYRSAQGKQFLRMF